MFGQFFCVYTIAQQIFKCKEPKTQNRKIFLTQAAQKRSCANFPFFPLYDSRKKYINPAERTFFYFFTLVIQLGEGSILSNSKAHRNLKEVLLQRNNIQVIDMLNMCNELLFKYFCIDVFEVLQNFSNSVILYLFVEVILKIIHENAKEALHKEL